MRLISWCNKLIKFGFILLFTFVPLLVTKWNYELFEYNKMMAVYALTALITGAWITKMIAQKELRIVRTSFDIPIILFVLSQLVSAIFSMDPHVSWFGYYSRFNGGMWSVISYVLLFYAFVSNFASGDTYHVSSKKKTQQTVTLPDTGYGMPNDIIVFLKSSLITVTLVALFGVLERMGIDKHIWVQDVQNRVFSTLGQPNWLAAYLISFTPLAMVFAIQSLTTKGKTTLRSWITFGVYAVLNALFFITLLYTRSRSGLLGLAVADVIFWGILFLSSPRRRGSQTTKSIPDQVGNDIVKPIIILHVLFALIVLFNGTNIAQVDKFVTIQGWKNLVHKVTNQQSNKVTTTNTGYTAPALESGGTESGVIRKYVWQAAVTAWKSSLKTKLIGTGTETFAFAFYQYRPVAHNLTSEWDFLYNKAHNEYLNYLATTGVLGLISYLLFIGSFILWIIRRQSHADTQPAMQTNDMIILALFAGWASYLVTNFFGFSVVVTQIGFFLFPALALGLAQSGEHTVFRKSLNPPTWFIWIPGILTLWTIASIGSFWYADTLYAAGYQFDRANMYGQAIPTLVRATTINPNEPMYHDELASSYATLAVAAMNAENATQAAQLAQLALAESDKALHISAKNVNFLKTRTKVYYTLSPIDAALNRAAIRTLEQAAILSPNDPKIYYNLAILSGREKLNDQAVQYLLKAKALKKDYRDAYYALSAFYEDMRNKDAAKAILQEYLTRINPNDSQFKELLNAK